MKILFVSSEVVPFSKTGGLADVAYALPKALIEDGIDVRIMTPRNFYQKKKIIEEKFLFETEVEVGWRKQYLGVSSGHYNGVPYYFLDNQYYFNRESLYGYYDDGERYAYFCRAVLEALAGLDFEPDIIHFNDWHTGMIPLLLKKHYQHILKFKNIKMVYTIHNLKYQGVFHPDVLQDLLNLDRSEFDFGAIEFYGNINFMKSGISFADAVTTVSETYLNEIKTPFFGENLQDVIVENQNKMFGIVNGIDYELFNPETDQNIIKNYSHQNSSLKSENKKDLQAKFGLQKTNDKPIIAMVTRLTDQKGLDLIAHIIEELLQENLQLLVLGTGDKKYEKLLERTSNYSENLAVKIGFDEGLAHQVYAGADMFLMPSKFEPCGLSQMISQRYGTVPIVRETGGLKDTVLAYNKYTGEGSGFSFEIYNAHEMLFTIKKSLELYQDKKAWRSLVKRIMLIDSSWAQSAAHYKKLYESLIEV